MKILTFLGKFIFICGYPVIWLVLKYSHRAYIVIDTGDKVLMTKNWIGMHNLWRLPGGGLKNQENYKQAASRELFEELGVKINPSQLKEIKYYHNGCKYFVCESKETQLLLKKSEIYQAEFIAKKQLAQAKIDYQVAAVFNILGWS